MTPARMSADLSGIRTERLRDVDLARCDPAAAALVRSELAVRAAERDVPVLDHPRERHSGAECDPALTPQPRRDAGGRAA